MASLEVCIIDNPLKLFLRDFSVCLLDSSLRVTFWPSHMHGWVTYVVFVDGFQS